MAPLSFTATTILVGVSIAGAMASLAVCIYYMIQRTHVSAWLFAFESLAAGRFAMAATQFKEQMQPPTPPLKWDTILKPEARQALACLEPQYGSIYDSTEGNNSDPPERAVGHALLMLACAEANKDSHPKDWSARAQTTKEWDNDLAICRLYLSHSYNGLRRIDPVAVIDDLRTKHPPHIAIPRIMSPGHGLLLTIVDWTSKMDLERDFNEKGELIHHLGANLDYLKGWQASVQKCLQWMQRRNVFGPLEQSIVTPLLEATNMRDFVKVLKGISYGDRETLVTTLVG